MAVNWTNDRIADGQVRVSIPGFGIAVTNCATVGHAMGDLLNLKYSHLVELCEQYTGIPDFRKKYVNLTRTELIFILLDAGYEWQQNPYYLTN